MFDVTTMLHPDLSNNHRNASLSVLIIKPDAVQKGAYIEEALVKESFQLLVRLHFRFTLPSVRYFYQEHEGQEFFARHVDFMLSGGCTAYLVTAYATQDVPAALRRYVGATDPTKAALGTLRQRFGWGLPQNAVHASADAAAALREARLLFAPRHFLDVGFLPDHPLLLGNA